MDKITIRHEDLHDEDWAAELLGVSKNTLANWRYMRRGPAYVKLGRKIYYTTDDVDAYISSQRFAPGPRQAG